MKDQIKEGSIVLTVLSWLPNTYRVKRISNYHLKVLPEIDEVLDVCHVEEVSEPFREYEVGLEFLRLRE